MRCDWDYIVLVLQLGSVRTGTCQLRTADGFDSILGCPKTIRPTHRQGKELGKGIGTGTETARYGRYIT